MQNKSFGRNASLYLVYCCFNLHGNEKLYSLFVLTPSHPACLDRDTDGTYAYQWDLQPVTFPYLVMAARTNGPVHLALSTEANNVEQAYEIIIRGQSSDGSVIRRSVQGPDLVSAYTRGINIHKV